MNIYFRTNYNTTVGIGNFMRVVMLAEKLKNTETELETLKESGNAGAASTSGLANEAGMRARALEAQLSAMKAENERQKESFNQEREKLQKEIKQMATQQTQTVKPTVSSAPSTARVKSQPQVFFFK